MTPGGGTARRRRGTPTTPGSSIWPTKLTPRGVAGVVLANGSLSSQQSGEGEIRQTMVEDDLVECIVALPPSSSTPPRSRSSSGS